MIRGYTAHMKKEFQSITGREGWEADAQDKAAWKGAADKVGCSLEQAQQIGILIVGLGGPDSDKLKGLDKDLAFLGTLAGTCL